MNLQIFFRLLSRYWWLLTLTVLIGFGSVVFFTFQQTPLYEATVSLVVAPEGTLKEGYVIDSLNSLDRRTLVATVAQISSSDTVCQKGWARIKPAGQQRKDYTVRTLILPDTNILQTKVLGPDRTLATSFANAVAAEAQASVKQFYATYQLTILDPAVVPEEPASPNWKRNLSVGILGSLILGTALILLAEYFDQDRTRRLSKDEDGKEEKLLT